MKKKYNLILFVILGMFLFIGNVGAAEDTTCNSVSLNELRTQAANIKVSYVPGTHVMNTEYDGEFEEETEYVRNHLDIKIFNMNSRLYIKSTASGNKIKSDAKILSFKDVGSDGAITLRQDALSEIVTYEFTIMSDAYGCSNKTLRKIRLSLPRYNDYTNTSVCQDIPEFYLCQKYTTYQVDGSTFYSKVDEYKAKLLELEEKNGEIDIDETNIITKTASTIAKYKYIVVGIIVAIGVIITIFILKRKKSVL